jgi:hypothetical protein
MPRSASCHGRPPKLAPSDPQFEPCYAQGWHMLQLRLARRGPGHRSGVPTRLTHVRHPLGMLRTPPTAVRTALRTEVGFRCPVPGCGSPYLTWHHFDPPWRERQHHDIDGMIALCLEHHAHADAGAFTREELHAIKLAGGRDNPAPTGTLSWMRKDLIAFIGGNFYVDVAVAVQVGRHPIVWFNRDDQNRVLVNLHLPSMSGKGRLRMVDNFWIETGDPEDLECPPSGTTIKARYANGDRVSVRFREIESKEAFGARYPDDKIVSAALAEAGSPMNLMDIALNVAVSFPVAVVEIELSIADTPVQLQASGTTVQDQNRVGAWVMDSPLGYVVRVPKDHPWAGVSEFEKSLRGKRP